jgi:type IV secretion system protein VirD4
MQTPQIILLTICSITFIVVGLIIYIGNHYSLNRIKNKTIGNGQHGTAKFATKSEIHSVYKRLSYTPRLWRQGQNRPLIQGLIVGCEQRGRNTTALIDDSDVHCLMIGASGVGKTAYFLYPN